MSADTQTPVGAEKEITMTMTMTQLMEKASRVSEKLAKTRDKALPEAREACRALESALQEALDGEPLRGLKNIGLNGQTLYAARIRAEHPDTKLLRPNERGSAVEFLCLDAKGQLITAWWGGERDRQIIIERIKDDYLRVDDVSGLVRAYAFHQALPISTCPSMTSRMSPSRCGCRYCRLSRFTTM